jgi:predicted ATPase
LRRVELREITPLTVLLGPNGSGKSTVFDVLSFLSECFQYGLRNAWDRRGRARELRTRGEAGPISIGLRYTDAENGAVVAYVLRIDEELGSPVVRGEELRVTSPGATDDTLTLSYSNGEGFVLTGDPQDKQRVAAPLRSPDLIAVNALGQLAGHPYVAALREFISDWQISYLSISDTRGPPEAGPQERLSVTGDNLANVIQYLKEQYPQRLTEIVTKLAQSVPLLETITTEELADGRLMLRVKDAPFTDPILARFASDGTLKILAYLVMLRVPNPPRFIGIEEPENYLHPRLMYPLAEEFRAASGRSQLLVTTHSPYFLDGLRPDEVRVLYRDTLGHTQAVRASDLADVREFMADGGMLGDLWMEGRFHVGDPVTNSGMPVHRTAS